MSSANSYRLMVLLLAASMLISGCNAFEGFDRSVTSGDHAAIAGEAKLELASANYAKAFELYDRLVNENAANDEIWRGRAGALAGLAGFNMFSVLNILQNEALPPDTSPVIFKAALSITDAELLEKAITDMNKLIQPGNDDRLFRSLMAALSAARRLFAKYDTNLSKKLDLPDQIDFDTNDDKTLSWQQLYSRFSDDTAAFSLERSFIELTQALDGRGSEWLTVSPIQGVNHKGTYTPANRSMILAVGNFATVLQQANAWFDASEAKFKSELVSLDGAN
jgi:predicted small secreted protein